MSNAVFYCSFELNKDADVSAFLAAAEKLNNEYISKQKGYISWKQLCDGNTWADFLTFETMEDVKKFEAESENAGELAQAFFSFINFDSIKQHCFAIERSYSK
ncbi:MAG: hypothetical protein FWC89_06545 [Defluviitaleaceae bacterium]|nr:hypothetical protein [Defluviitaleaceae bacterium]